MSSEPGGAPEAGFLEAMALLATGVTVVTVADGRDDIGSTVSAFCSISADPPIVMLSVFEESYLCEVVGAVGRFAVNVLGAQHRALAGRFAAEGRPSARVVLAREPHHRGEHTGALILDTALAALECEVEQRVGAGDHTVFLARVSGLPEVGGPVGEMSPLIRWAGRYRGLG